MNTVETIQQKVDRLPAEAQTEVLQAVEQIEQRYQRQETFAKQNGEPVHALTLIANMAKDAGVTDLAERHDFYAHGKLED